MAGEGWFRCRRLVERGESAPSESSDALRDRRELKTMSKSAVVVDAVDGAPAELAVERRVERRVEGTCVSGDSSHANIRVQI